MIISLNSPKVALPLQVDVMARAASKQDVTAMLLAWKTVPKCLVPESEPLLSGAGSRRLSVLIY